MADSHDIGLMAHLMRRAGFGASREELEMRAAQGYNATVEELLHPEESEPADQNVLLRYQPAALLPGGQPPMGNINWMFNLVNTRRPLQEKMALFWHHVFATGNSKVDNYDQLLEQIDLFREKGMGNYRELLVALSQNPAMIYWLDNQENHKRAVNENWGRELLELFSMGQGNYTEKDVREASRAFTGWGIAARFHGCRTGVSPGNLSTTLKITMRPTRSSWAIRAISMVKTSSILSCSNPPVRLSFAATWPTSSWPMSRRSQAGILSRPRIHSSWQPS